jgi:tetratricopeptide (TPR) repeat protein
MAERPVLDLATPNKRRDSRRLLAFFVALSVVAIAGGGWWLWDRHRASSLLETSQDLIRRNDLPGALVALDQYTSLRPKSLEGLFLAARVARRTGKFPEAKRYLATYEEMGGAPDAVRLERDLLLLQQGLIGDRDKRLRGSIGPDHPDVTLVLEALARGYMIAERWADARQACALWRAVDAKAPWAWLWGGRVSERMVQVDQAAEFYRKALELAPEDRDARVAFARVQLRQNSPATAKPHLEWVLQRVPEDEEALLGMAQCLLAEAKGEEALALVDKALGVNPTSNLAMSLRGRVVLEQGNAVEAEPWLRKAWEAERGDSETLHLLVRALRLQGKNQEAGDLEKQLDRLQKSLKRLNELMRMIGPQLQELGPCLEAGEIALQVGRTEQGLNLLEDALRRKGDHRPVHAALARYYRGIGRLDLAEVQQGLAEKP